MPTELIAVLDVDSREEALSTVQACGECQWFKIGAQLFTRCGPPIVREVIGLNKKVFLDLKYHDIPNTVGKAVRAATDMGVSLLTLHASGGRAMIERARQETEGTDTRLLAVTVLTSLSEKMLREELGLPESPAQAVPRLAQMAVEAGAHGIVCSPREIAAVREAVGPDALIVTPGIRPAWAGKNDQVRVMSPKEAAEAGADFIVVGRPILSHEDPSEAARLILEELTL